MATMTGKALSAAEFKAVSELMYGISGVNLTPGKEGLVESRLASRLRALSLDSFTEYLAFVKSDPKRVELTTLVDLLTTNKTNFFREVAHFDYLKECVLPDLAQRRGARFWCAGCSSGEEPYTLAMVLAEAWNASQLSGVKILATDLSTRVLARAAAAEYDEAAIGDMAPERVRRHFNRSETQGGARYQVKQPLRQLVHTARLNLMGDWPMKGPFQVIFCRNVVIYFNEGLRDDVLAKMTALLSPGGHLYVGHSERLKAFDGDLRFVGLSTYQRFGRP